MECLRLGTLLLAVFLAADALARPALPASHYPQTVKTSVNGELSDVPVQVIRADDNSLYLRALDLLALGVPLSYTDAIVVDGYRFVPADELDGVEVRADLAQQRLWLRHSVGHEWAPSAYARPEPMPNADEVYSEVNVRVVVDNTDTGQRITLLKQYDRWLIAVQDLKALDLPVPDLQPLKIRGGDYLVLDALWPYALGLDTTWRFLNVARSPSPPLTTDELRETWIEINVNQSRRPALVRALVGPGNRYFVGKEILERFQLRRPERALERDGETFYEVAAIPAATPVFNQQQQSLAIYAKADAFVESRLQGREFEYVEPDFSHRGALLNYALVGSGSEDEDNISGQFELGAFWGRGFVSTRQVVRDLGGAQRDSVRLETNLRIDWPEQMRSLTLGDGLTRAGASGRPVRFGGLQWGTNFSTQPGFITFPTETVAGSAVVPSTVDIFVNNARRSSSRVEPGPFTVTDVPVVTGAGEMRIVTRDLLGRETVISRPFYASSQLLKAGLHDYSYTAGALRRGFTQRSNDYGTGFVSGLHRYGVTDWFTGEARLEVSTEQSSAGLGANLVWPAVAEFDISVAASRDESGRSGERVEAGLRRRADTLSFGTSAIWRSREFAPLGAAEGVVPDALESRSFVALGLGPAGSLTLSHVRRNQRNEPDTEFATFQYSFDVGRLLRVRVSYLEPLSESLARSATVSFSLPLGRRSSTQLSARRSEGQTTARAQLQRNLPAGRGFGYRLSAESGRPDRYDADIRYRGDAGLVGARVGQVDDRRRYQASLDGGIAYLGGRPYLTRRLDRSFALVRVPGMAGVDIYRDNQVLGTTNDEGTALIPDLRDYQKNQIRIEDAALPLDIEVASLEKTAVPAFRHGMTMEFSVNRARWVGFRLVDETGIAVPAGAKILHIATGKEALIGDNGQGYLELDPGKHEFRVWWRSRHCRVEVDVPRRVDVMPDLGEYVCE